MYREVYHTGRHRETSYQGIPQGVYRGVYYRVYPKVYNGGVLPGYASLCVQGVYYPGMPPCVYKGVNSGVYPG